MLGSKFANKMRAATVLVALLHGVGGLAHPSTASFERSLGGDIARDVADECPDSSQSTTHWKIEDFVLKVYDWDDGGSMGTFGFTSHYDGTNTTVECMVEDVDLAKLADGTWSKCGTTGTEFQFDLNDISLTMKETWTCSE